ncbi:hypothetical protein CAPTEDRAFT_171414 [Capitella teleta]|uniref:Ribosome biogenesis regulatory protein n=1 Tax=Capitella teleta TaxID=283909 RepID=R7TEQ6_CAPTE|nr:hypothetical protein CAPTEDRAFT_171414 [Capitella teleta]|eukprot:ELT92238.1 hypothetical protein CAPTEDRAFT_171414 [Capitella teleta]
MAAIVESVLQAEAEKNASYKSTEVDKAIELDIDEGNLVAVDLNPINGKHYRSKCQTYLNHLARDNAQILFNAIWQLPTKRVDEAIVAVLPEKKTSVPREKPVPKDQPMTRWEQYAKLKNIHKRKKETMVWDDAVKEWRPRFGYKKAGDEKRDWMLEVPQSADPYEDQFEKRGKAKNERVAKNELQRLRNVARNMKGKIPGVGLTPTDAPDVDHVKRSLAQAQKSTASLGRFDQKLSHEKPARNLGKKRKAELSSTDASAEKKRSLSILEKVQSNRPTLDTAKAVNQLMANEEAKSEGKAEKGQRKGRKGRSESKGDPTKGRGGKGSKKSMGKRKGGKGGKK